LGRIFSAGLCSAELFWEGDAGGHQKDGAGSPPSGQPEVKEGLTWRGQPEEEGKGLPQQGHGATLLPWRSMSQWKAHGSEWESGGKAINLFFQPAVLVAEGKGGKERKNIKGSSHIM